MSEKSISERFTEVWGKLSHNQQRFVVAMQESASKREGAEAIGLEPDTIYRWPAIVDEAVELMRANVRDSALAILSNSVAKAAMVKIAGLDSDNERIRQDAATEVLDRALGKPAQKTELTGADGGPVKTQDVNIDLGKLSTEQLQQLIGIVEAAQAQE